MFILNILGGELSLFDSINNEETDQSAAIHETVMVPNHLTDSILKSGGDDSNKTISNSNLNTANTEANSNINVFSDLSGAF